MEKYGYSYLHVVKPHLHFTDPERIPEKHYPFARRKFEDMQQQVLLKEEQACFYLYRITDERLKYSYTGFVGLASVDDYLSGKIKVHEHTLSRKEEALVQHIEHVKAVGEPVLLTFKGGEWYDRLIEKTERLPPVYSFSGEEQVKSEIWPVCDGENIRLIREHLAATEALYIADGHHRSAGAVRYCQKKRAECPSFSGEEAFNFFLAYFIPTDRLKIFEFNRLVKDLNGQKKEEFMAKLESYFQMEKIEAADLEIKKENYRFGMYIDRTWYGLNLLEKMQDANVLQRLDVSILEDFVLNRTLGICDSKTDQRLSFLDGTKGIDRLQELVDTGEFCVAFSLFPTKIDEVLEVADRGLTMPPKSTWFEPKLRTGLLIYQTDED
jgi:uncharacterized protein (DUF1015 family)